MGDPGAKGLSQSTDIRHTGDLGSVWPCVTSLTCCAVIGQVRCPLNASCLPGDGGETGAPGLRGPPGDIGPMGMHGPPGEPGRSRPGENLHWEPPGQQTRSSN